MARLIKLLGDPAIHDADGQPQPVRGHQAWALLARVLLARRPLDRRLLAAELFPDVDDPLGALRWCLASLRKALNSSDCLRGDPVEANIPPDITIDLRSIEQDDFDIEAAEDLLGGIEPRCSPGFATWLLVERGQIASTIAARLRREVVRALAVKDHDRAVRLAEIAVRRGPFDESCHILLVKSLALAGRHDAARAHVDATEKAFLDELGERPTPALRSAARRTISAPPAGISPEAFVNSSIQSGLAALSAGAADAGVDCLRRAVSDAEKLASKHLQARATLELGTALVHAVRGYDDEGSVLLRQSTELAHHAGATAIAAAGFRELGYVEALAGRRPAAAQYLAQALACADDDIAAASIRSVIGFNLVDWGRPDDGIAEYHVALDHARRAGNKRREIWALGLGAWGLLALDRLDDAEQWLETCLGLIEEQNWLAFRPWPLALRGELKLRRGDTPDALLPGLEEAFAMSCQMADPCWEAANARALALAHAATGALPVAMEWLSEARRRCFRTSDGYAALQVEIIADQVALSRRQNRPDLCDRFVRDWIAMAARTHMDAHVARAAAMLALG